MTRTFPLLAAVSIFALSPVSAAHHETDSNGAVDIAATQEALTTAEKRKAEDKARDIGRKPAEVLHYLGLEQGDTVLDLVASGGWYSEVLAIATGPEGKVYAQNPAAALALFDGAYEKAINARLAANPMPQLVRLNTELTDLGVPDNSVDLALTALNFHDVYNSFGADAAIGMMRAVKAKLKPGGVLGVIDHVGAADADNTPIHRIDPALVEAAAKTAGFQVERNDAILDGYDDLSKNVFDPAVKGKTDRFILKLTKPKD